MPLSLRGGAGGEKENIYSWGSGQGINNYIRLGHRPYPKLPPFLALLIRFSHSPRALLTPFSSFADVILHGRCVLLTSSNQQPRRHRLRDTFKPILLCHPRPRPPPPFSTTTSSALLNLSSLRSISPRGGFSFWSFLPLRQKNSALGARLIFRSSSPPSLPHDQTPITSHSSPCKFQLLPPLQCRPSSSTSTPKHLRITIVKYIFLRFTSPPPFFTYSPPRSRLTRRFLRI